MKGFKYYLTLFVIVVLAPIAVLASTSTNFEATKEHGGPVNFNATSSNYEFRAEIGHPGAGLSTSTNYEFWHGTYWEEDDQAQVTIQWAVPELRIGATSTNDDTLFYLTIRSAANNEDTILYTSPVIASTTNQGTYLTPLLMTNIQPGTYDIGFKGHQHLTKVLQDVYLTGGNNVLNFTNTTNTTAFGSQRLLAGDINGTTSTPAVMGDDVINSIDLSLMLFDLDLDDPSGNERRPNVNQDVIVNSVDLSILLKNLDLVGDK
ncbi:MAG: hypothetical protein ACOYUZ_04050 [Patescibacteria group bacterium]